MKHSQSPTVAVVTLAILFHAVGELKAASPPNIVVILADDLGYGDLGCFGCRVWSWPTPTPWHGPREAGRRTTTFHAGRETRISPEVRLGRSRLT